MFDVYVYFCVTRFSLNICDTHHMYSCDRSRRVECRLSAINNNYKSPFDFFLGTSLVSLLIAWICVEAETAYV